MHRVIGSTWAESIALGRWARSGTGCRSGVRSWVRSGIRSGIRSGCRTYVWVMRYRRLTLIIHRAAVGQVRIARWLAWIRDLVAGATRISPAVTGARVGIAWVAAGMEAGTVTGRLRIRGGGQVRQVLGPLLGRSGRVARRPGQVVGRPGPLVRRWLRQVVGWPGPLVRRWLGQVLRRPGPLVRRRLRQVLGGPGPLLRRWLRQVLGRPGWPGQVLRRPGLLLR